MNGSFGKPLHNTTKKKLKKKEQQKRNDLNQEEGHRCRDPTVGDQTP